VRVLDGGVEGLAVEVGVGFDEGRAVHLDMFLCFLGRGGGWGFVLVAEVVAMRDLSLGWYLYRSYFFGTLVHLEVVEVVDARTALYWLHFLQVILLEVIAHCLLVIIIKQELELY
jgi:hypothetical protein